MRCPRAVDIRESARGPSREAPLALPVASSMTLGRGGWTCARVSTRALRHVLPVHICQAIVRAVESRCGLRALFSQQFLHRLRESFHTKRLVEIVVDTQTLSPNLMAFSGVSRDHDHIGFLAALLVGPF